LARPTEYLSRCPFLTNLASTVRTVVGASFFLRRSCRRISLAERGLLSQSISIMSASSWPKNRLSLWPFLRNIVRFVLTDRSDSESASVFSCWRTACELRRLSVAPGRRIPPASNQKPRLYPGKLEFLLLLVRLPKTSLLNSPIRLSAVIPLSES
jgi:hypothetical protein